MTESPENVKKNLQEQSDDLEARFDQEFRWYMRDAIAGVEKIYAEEVQNKRMDAAEAEAKLEKRRQELASLDFYGRISDVTDNFHFWWPGGWYRDIKIRDKERKGGDQTKIKGYKKLVQDLDAVIRERGYTSIAQNVVSRQGIDRETRLRALADVYLAMREKGYDGYDLAR